MPEMMSSTSIGVQPCQRCGCGTGKRRLSRRQYGRRSSVASQPAQASAPGSAIRQAVKTRSFGPG